MKRDIVYTLGKGAAATDDWELRMSLRAWGRFGEEVAGAFVIVGDAPDWLDSKHERIVHLPHPDPYRGNKDANLIQKLLRASLSDQVSKEFVYCSDDQGPLRTLKEGDFEPFHCGPIDEVRLAPEGDAHRMWQERLIATGEFLKGRGVPCPLYYDGHIPYLLTRDQVQAAISCDFGASPGYTVMSLLYGLTPPAGVARAIHSQRIRAGLYSDDERPALIDDKLGKNRFYSIGNGSPDCWYLVASIEELFAEPAEWELDGADWVPRREAILNQAVAAAEDAELLLSKLGYGVTKPAKPLPADVAPKGPMQVI